MKQYLSLALIGMLGLSATAQKKEIGKLITIDSTRSSRGFYDMAFELETGVVRVVTGCPQSARKGAKLNMEFLLTYGKKDTIYLSPIANKK